MNIIVAAIIAIVLIPLVSLLTSKMKSLPIDFICSAISISVISLDIFYELNRNDAIGENAGYMLFLVNLAILIFSGISVCGFLLYDKDSTEYKEAVKRGAYLYSLFTSCVTINFAYIYVKHSGILFPEEFDEAGALGNFFDTLNSMSYIHHSRHPQTI